MELRRRLDARDKIRAERDLELERLVILNTDLNQQNEAMRNAIMQGKAGAAPAPGGFSPAPPAARPIRGKHASSRQPSGGVFVHP